MNMKRILSCLLLGATYLLASAQDIVIYKTDGTQISIPVEGLDSIAFQDAGSGPIVPPNPNVTPITVENLVTTEWEDGGLNFSNDYTMTFTADQVTVKSGNDVAYQGGYTLENNVISFVMDGITYKSMAGLAGGGSVLIMKEAYEDGIENPAFVLVQKGKTVSTKKEDIQGQWVWWDEYLDPDNNLVKTARLSYKFDGDKFEIIIVGWGQKYTGTYTYENGIVKLNTTAGYTSREPGTGYGVGEGNLDPVTLEGIWWTLDKDHWNTPEDGLFFTVGDEAFSFIMMPSICKKKQ